MYLNSECVTETYNCEDFKDSGSTQGLRFYARSNINDLGTETCVQGYQTTFLLIFWEDQTIAGVSGTCFDTYCHVNPWLYPIISMFLVP